MFACMKRFLFLFLFTLLCMFFTLPVFAKNTILIIGDSLSAGYGIDPHQGWAALLQNRLRQENYDYDVINESISGDTTSNGLKRLPRALKIYHPKITIIALGANDGLRGLQIATIKDNLARMIALAQTNKSLVMIVGVRLPLNYGPIYHQQFQQMFSELAEEKKVSILPNLLNKIDEDISLFQQDRLHPTVKAQELILNNVWPALQKLITKN